MLVSVGGHDVMSLSNSETLPLIIPIHGEPAKLSTPQRDETPIATDDTNKHHRYTRFAERVTTDRPCAPPSIVVGLNDLLSRPRAHYARFAEPQPQLAAPCGATPCSDVPACCCVHAQGVVRHV